MAKQTWERRHHGGQELPDSVQDRPEQNAGYDAAVRGTGAAGTDIELVPDEDVENDLGTSSPDPSHALSHDSAPLKKP